MPKWLWPVAGSIRVIVHPFNEPRSYGKHEGVDVRAALGVDVVAVAPGIVDKVYRWTGGTTGNNAYGNHIRIKHDDGYSTFYAHLSAIKQGLAVGQRVTTGQHIGDAGSTGNSTAAHLHFQAMHPLLGLDGYVYPKVVDPTPFITGVTMPKILSTSRIGIHNEIISPAFTNWLDSLEIWPNNALVCETGTAAWLKSRAPGMVIYYRWTEHDYRAQYYLDKGEQGGIEFADNMPKSPAIDYYTGLNEPSGGTREGLIKTINFYIGFAKRCKQLGIKPCGPQIAVGNPDTSLVLLMRDMVLAILDAGGVISYHGYSAVILAYAKEWLAMRAAIQWRDQLGIQFPLYLSEGLWDYCTDDIPDGPWRDLLRDNHLTLTGMRDQLESINQLCIQHFVRGLAAFTVGGLSEWVRYDFLLNTGAMAMLRDHWAAHVGEQLPPADPPITTIPGPLPLVMYVTAQPRVNLRSEPSTTSRDIGNVYYRHAVKPLEKRDNWYRVGFSGKDIDGIAHDIEGWIVGEWLSVNRP